jgi:hypothetical protein
MGPDFGEIVVVAAFPEKVEATFFGSEARPARN